MPEPLLVDGALETGDGPTVREDSAAALVVANQCRAVEERPAGEPEHCEKVDEEVPRGARHVGPDRAQGVKGTRVGDPKRLSTGSAARNRRIAATASTAASSWSSGVSEATARRLVLMRCRL